MLWHSMPHHAQARIQRPYMAALLNDRLHLALQVASPVRGMSGCSLCCTMQCKLHRWSSAACGRAVCAMLCTHCPKAGARPLGACSIASAPQFPRASLHCRDFANECARISSCLLTMDPGDPLCCSTTTCSCCMSRIHYQSLAFRNSAETEECGVYLQVQDLLLW